MAGKLPAALDRWDEIFDRDRRQRIILCLDYDGTLTPIVTNYNEAIISDRMRALVHALARKMPVAIISGRDVPFIQQHMRLPEAYYAGSHGFEVIGPNAYRHELEEAGRILPILDRVENEMREFARSIPGVEIERKKFAMAVHFRKANEEQRPAVEQKVAGVLQANDRLKAGKGKMLLELKPAIDWHKGKALDLIVNELDPERSSRVIFIGDDITDEDAFRVLNDDDVGIFVGEPEHSSAAHYQLKDVAEVEAFLNKLNDRF